MADPIETHLLSNMNLSRKHIMINNFLGGLAWGFGSVVGAVVVVALIGSLLKSVGFFDGVSQFFDNNNVRGIEFTPKLYR